MDAEPHDWLVSEIEMFVHATLCVQQLLTMKSITTRLKCDTDHLKDIPEVQCKSCSALNKKDNILIVAMGMDLHLIMAFIGQGQLLVKRTARGPLGLILFAWVLKKACV